MMDPDQGASASSPARQERTRRLLRALLWCQASGEQDVIIRNLSRRGLGGSTVSAELPVGAEVVVSILPGFNVTGTVRWVRGMSFGINLLQDLDLDEVAREQQRLLASGNSEGQWEVHSRHRAYRIDSGLPTRRI